MQQETISFRKQVITFSIVAMLAGLFLPRVVLSCSTILFITACLLHKNSKAQWQHFIHSPLLVGMSLLFLYPLLSGCWSSDLAEWKTILQIKLPLLFFPLAFAGLPAFSKKEQHRIASLLVLLVVLGTIWSMLHYLLNKPAIDHDYLHAKTIPTPLEDDHVRFSWFVSMAVLLLASLYSSCSSQLKKWQKASLLIIALWLVVYLHILAARTGLLFLYAMLLLTAAWLIFYKTKKWMGVLLLSGLIAIPVLAYQLLPTFQNRFRYLRYEFSFFKEDQYLPGSNDGTRIASLKAGWHILNQHPLSGAGFGDIYNETKAYYKIAYPGMPENNQIYPSNQLLLFGAGLGWPGLVVCLLVLLLPFLYSNFRKQLYWWMLNAGIIISFLPDNPLEVQYGVFLYAFVLLWCRDWWLRAETNSTI